MTVEQARHYNLEQAFTWKLGIWQGGRLILGRGWLSSTARRPQGQSLAPTKPQL